MLLQIRPLKNTALKRASSSEQGLARGCRLLGGATGQGGGAEVSAEAGGQVPRLDESDLCASQRSVGSKKNVVRRLTPVRHPCKCVHATPVPATVNPRLLLTTSIHVDSRKLAGRGSVTARAAWRWGWERGRERGRGRTRGAAGSSQRKRLWRSPTLRSCSPNINTVQRSERGAEPNMITTGS